MRWRGSPNAPVDQRRQGGLALVLRSLPHDFGGASRSASSRILGNWLIAPSPWI